MEPVRSCCTSSFKLKSPPSGSDKDKDDLLTIIFNLLKERKESCPFYSLTPLSVFKDGLSCLHYSFKAVLLYRPEEVFWLYFVVCGEFAHWWSGEQWAWVDKENCCLISMPSCILLCDKRLSKKAELTNLAIFSVVGRVQTGEQSPNRRL